MVLHIEEQEYRMLLLTLSQRPSYMSGTGKAFLAYLGRLSINGRPIALEWMNSRMRTCRLRWSNLA